MLDCFLQRCKTLPFCNLFLTKTLVFVFNNKEYNRESLRFVVIIFTFACIFKLLKIMKKLFFTVLVSVLCVSFAKAQGETRWNYIKGAAAINSSTLEGNAVGKATNHGGWDLLLGHAKKFSGFDFYYGIEYGIGSRGYCIELLGEEFGSSWAGNIKASPMVGYKYDFANGLSIDAHVGYFASFDLFGMNKVKGVDSQSIWTSDNNYNHFDNGIRLGDGVWFERFLLDFTWQRGFVNFNTDSDVSNKSNAFIIGLGYQF